MSNDDKKRLLMVANCGVEFAVAVFIGSMIGLWIDRYFDKFPIFLVIFFLFGCVSGYLNVIRYIETIQKKSRQLEEQKK